MKLKSVALSTLLLASGLNSAFAQHHFFPGAEKQQAKTMAPGYCEVELYNNTFSTISIYAEYDSWNKLHFVMYPQERHYVSLDYNGYCHSSMYMEAYDANGMFYNKYTPVDYTLTFSSKLKQSIGVLKKK